MRHFSRPTLISAVCAFLVTAAPAYADEVSDFTVNATVAATGDLNIEEKILVDFGNNKKHGLLRKIPTYFASDNAELDLISAECPPGKACPKVISQLHQSLQLKLGEPKVLISGKHTYRLKYVIKNPAKTAGNTLSYEWSPNGKNWQMPIKTMTVNLNGISPAVCKSLVTAKEDGLPGATIYGTSGNYKVSAHDLQPGQVVLLKISLSAPSGQILSSSTTANKKTGILQSLTSLDHNVQVGLWIIVIVGFVLVLAALVKSQSNCSCRCGPVCSCMCGCRKGCTCQSTSFKEEPVSARRSVFGSGYNSYGNNDNYSNNYDNWDSNSSSSSSSWSSSDSSSSSSDSGGSGDSGGGDSW
ncbi:MAG: DUF2207 domain-containing protein [Candidatus Melainabacteria bacterium]|nr:DUF2207 domain-containing protein [Candidatus Melainabacteria bacterium]